ncbi:unnamed protein product [Fraxinus pennsylvanica]|uniref:Uncharacterized protein n=1 Tax=Fraxinus pennsylvanica TaxID=56036 RepID=A0AAD2A5X3_9LAMI|nr:unnamed protein product [Fraxinus pennsylvanica]
MTTDRATEDNQSAEISQTCTKSQETSNYITKGGKDKLLISIRDYVNDTTKKPLIARVPSLLRESKNGCFDPLVVSIGPYHHGNPKLKAFEELKIPIAQKFWHACENKLSIELMYETVAMEGERARECYEKDSACNDVELFNRIMFLDACFVLYVLCTNLQEEEQNEVTERLVKSFYSVLRDLLLLENQIPLLVLKVLLKFRFRREKDQTQFKQKFLKPYILMPPQGHSCTNAVMKFLAQMKGRSTTSGQEMNEWKLELDSSPHLLHLLREHFVSPFMHEDSNKSALFKWESNRTRRRRFDIGNKKLSRLIFGTLTLPPIIVADSEKTLLLNLAAYEISTHDPSELCITLYICLMDSLIDNAEGVKQPLKNGI